ncbi:lipocalin family protein [Gabonibacter sp. KD22]|nr:lipocalin family protein [Gabonibacter chumensis]MCR9010818.1 lipocalin family protein [Gabonibacter chumensis]
MTYRVENNGKCPKVDMHVVQELELTRYMGKWYEIARFDHRFERGLDRVTAVYSLCDDGKIKVVNSGYKDGRLHEARGKAKMPDPDEPGKLKVSFFWFFYSDYFILELDEEYSSVLIGSSSDKYLWILSRTPKLPDNKLKKLLTKAENRGYDTGKLIYINQ